MASATSATGPIEAQIRQEMSCSWWLWLIGGVIWTLVSLVIKGLADW